MQQFVAIVDTNIIGTLKLIQGRVSTEDFRERTLALLCLYYRGLCTTMGTLVDSLCKCHTVWGDDYRHWSWSLWLLF